MKMFITASFVLIALPAGADPNNNPSVENSASARGTNTSATGKIASKADTDANQTASRAGNPNGEGRDLRTVQSGAAQSAPET